MTGIKLVNAVDVGAKFVLWFRMGFAYYLVNALLLVLTTCGLLVGSRDLVNCGKTLCGCSCVFTFVWVILGSIWRMGPDG